MCLTETWIRPEDSATPAALSNNFSFSHPPREVGRGGGTGLLISNNCKYSTHSPLCNYNLFESHAITLIAPIKPQIVVIYRPPGQILDTFLEELDGLLSSFMEDGTPILVFGDFNIHLDKPYATDFHSLLASFDVKRLTTTSTHKSGNRLDLIYTRDFTADKILVQPLHISDHFFIKFTLHFATRVPPTPLPVTFRRNIRSLSPSHLSSVASLLSSLTYPFLISGCEYSYWHFMLYLNLFFRQHLSSLLQASTGCLFEPLVIRWSSWASDQTLSGREKTAQNKWSVGPKYVSTIAFIFLCWSPHCQILTFPQQEQQGSRRAYSLQNI